MQRDAMEINAGLFRAYHEKQDEQEEQPAQEQEDFARRSLRLIVEQPGWVHVERHIQAYAAKAFRDVVHKNDEVSRGKVRAMSDLLEWLDHMTGESE